MKRPDKWDKKAVRVLEACDLKKTKCAECKRIIPRVAAALRRTDAAARRQAYGAGYNVGYEKGSQEATDFQMKMRVEDAKERHAR